MKVGNLRKLLSDLLETLEDYNEEQELTLQGNTYFTKNHRYVLETPNGFLGLDNLNEAIDDEEDEEDEDAE
jgi:hypothetical protein